MPNDTNPEISSFIEINGSPYIHGVQVKEGEKFTAAGIYTNLGDPDKIAAAYLFCQRRDGAPAQITIDPVAISDNTDAADNKVELPVSGNMVEFGPAGSAPKRVIETGETGSVTFTATLTGKGEHYVYLLVRVQDNDTSSTQVMKTSRVFVV